MNYDIFIDESCHLEHDNFPAMTIGYIKVASKEYLAIRNKIKAIKLKHHTPTELKWTKVSASRMPMYKELIDYFFNNEYLSFRSVLVKYKERLDHTQYNQGSHDNFYYKMIYYLLRPKDNEQDRLRVFLDIKDTQGKAKLRKIQEVFKNHHHGNSPFKHFQHIRSHENEFIQLADLFIGAITYKARDEHLKKNANTAKVELINYIEAKSGYSIEEGTMPWEDKFNIFDHQPKKKNGRY
jgi:hypothetical protein